MRPTDPALLPLYDALRADEQLGAEAKRVGLKMVQKFMSAASWHPFRQAKLMSKMKQPNVSRAIQRLVELKFIEKRRQPDGDHKCQYRVAERFRKVSTRKRRASSVLEDLMAKGAG